MNAITSSPKTTLAGVGGGIIALVQSLALAFGWELTPEHYAAMTAGMGFLLAVIGLMGKDGDKA